MTFTTRYVDNGPVRLATRDYGGVGPALVLMHGAGMEQGSLEPLAELLRPAFRVLTFDYRGHGGTSLAPWTLASAVEDLAAVVDAYGLGSPAVGGHSLGGKVATAYGVQHPDCPAVINIDGHGRGRVDQYPGYDETEVRQWWEVQDRRFDRLTSGPVALAVKGLLRVLRKPTVSAETARQALQESDATDLFSLYRQLTCPFLVFNATAREERRAMKLLVGQGLSFVEAYRDGLGRDLAALAAEGSRTEVATVDATHMLIRTHPQLVAQRITDFLQRRLPRVPSAARDA